MLTRPTLLLLGLALSGALLAEQPEPPALHYLTESFPPYNYSDSNVLRGIAVDLLVSATQGSAQPVTRSQIRLLPWPRAYRMALQEPGSVLFSTTRSAERETLFKWAGPICATRVVLLALKSRQIRIDDPQQLRQYRIGVVPEDIGEVASLRVGVPRQQLQRSSSADALARQLHAGRIDLWAYDEHVARWFLRNVRLDPEDFEVVHVLQEGELWYAFHPQTDDQQVRQLQEALDRVRRLPGKIGPSLYDDILLNYL